MEEGEVSDQEEELDERHSQKRKYAGWDRYAQNDSKRLARAHTAPAFPPFQHLRGHHTHSQAHPAATHLVARPANRHPHLPPRAAAPPPPYMPPIGEMATTPERTGLIPGTRTPVAGSP
eukprot:CAMPEP_0177658890 /NCGR_PEP_ID=MMETSP0447-20121125/17118_1 /TAXON_ID=0 /ORGANISM="Stygamoeba regulata, Strain BSH-02190019" /LENGTH=118 /DNA_ID=CAMNT_0019163659 /DNA_START=194 /DNA_END=548 /DNA_ORIENTATION=-